MCEFEGVTDADLLPLTKLTTLNISRTLISDDAIKVMNLTSLELSERVSDVGLEGISDIGTSGLRDLTHLDITKVTNAGIKLLSNLTALNLAFNESITDEGIELIRLRTLSLQCASV
jgi:hypothetical protein